VLAHNVPAEWRILEAVSDFERYNRISITCRSVLPRGFATPKRKQIYVFDKQAGLFLTRTSPMSKALVQPAV
jgi:hypothetical protein